MMRSMNFPFCLRRPGKNYLAVGLIFFLLNLTGLNLVRADVQPVDTNSTSSASAPGSAGLLLVANKGDRSLTIIDPAAGRALATVPIGGNTGHEVAASPDGKRAFVPIYGDSGVGRPGSDGSLMRVIDLAKYKVAGTVNFGAGVRPHCVVFGPK